ncbi:MAG TPA: HD domain-containing phosphohydrolase [Terracidiphilus sp.]|nr:HD domain-containing phosphohydrolase [Terracidiphilus sp.]
MMKKTILAVDDEPNNLQVLRQILRDHYHVLYATSGVRALEAAERHRPNLVLLDIMMPDMAGYEVCSRLKTNPLTQNIPVIFVTSMGEVEDEARGFDVGAVDYVQKPVSAAVLLRRIETHLSLVRANAVEQSYRQAIFMLGEAGHYNDADTGRHTWRMAGYSRVLAAAAGWTPQWAQNMELAASLHDAGKIGVPESILRAPRRLTAEEWEVMKQHTEIGFRILSKCSGPIFTLAAEIARYHHEHWDGSGYPFGLAGNSIPESSRIVAVADVFDALTVRRPYKEAWTMEASLEEIRHIAGSHLEPRLVRLFEDVLPEILHIRRKWEEMTEEEQRATEFAFSELSPHALEQLGVQNGHRLPVVHERSATRTDRIA